MGIMTTLRRFIASPAKLPSSTVEAVLPPIPQYVKPVYPESGELFEYGEGNWPSHKGRPHALKNYHVPRKIVCPNGVVLHSYWYKCPPKIPARPCATSPLRKITTRSGHVFYSTWYSPPA